MGVVTKDTGLGWHAGSNLLLPRVDYMAVSQAASYGTKKGMSATACIYQEGKEGK